MLKNNKSQNPSRFKIFAPIAVLSLLVIGIYFGMTYFKKSLFTVMKVPSFELRDQNSVVISDKKMLGKVYLVEFFYSTCPTICPVMNSNMKFIENEINSPDFGIISISIDPENDTPEVLKKHSKKLGAKENWHFLSGDRTYIGKLADQFDIYVGDKEDESESLNHSGMIALVDKQGNIRCRYNQQNMPILYYSGLNFEDVKGETASFSGKYHPDREALIEDIRSLLK